MAIQRVNISSMSDADIASLLGMTCLDGCMNREGIYGNKGFWFSIRTLPGIYLDKTSGQTFVSIDAGSNVLSYEKTENTCVFGLNSSLSEERLNCGYTLGTKLSTGEKVWVYFMIGGSVAVLSTLTGSVTHTIKSTLTFEDDEAVSMVNYYIPELDVFCDYLYSLVTYKKRSDYSYNRFKLNDAYYIKPSGNDVATTAPTTRYDCFAVRTG